MCMHKKVTRDVLQTVSNLGGQNWQGEGGYYHSLHLYISVLLKFFFFFFFLIFGYVGSSVPRWLSLVVVSGGYSSLRCTGFSFLIAVASLVAEHRLQAREPQQLQHTGSVVVARRLQSTGSVVVAHELSCSTACGILLDQGSNLSPALAGRFLTTAPPGKSLKLLLLQNSYILSCFYHQSHYTGMCDISDKI